MLASVSAVPEEEILHRLGKAAKANSQVINGKSRVIITYTTGGYIPYTKNWAASLIENGITNFLIVAEDSEAYKALNDTPALAKHAFSLSESDYEHRARTSGYGAESQVTRIGSG